MKALCRFTAARPAAVVRQRSQFAMTSGYSPVKSNLTTPQIRPRTSCNECAKPA